jgi:hypothetical protein
MEPITSEYVQKVFENLGNSLYRHKCIYTKAGFKMENMSFFHTQRIIVLIDGFGETKSVQYKSEEEYLYESLLLLNTYSHIKRESNEQQTDLKKNRLNNINILN